MRTAGHAGQRLRVYGFGDFRLEPGKLAGAGFVLTNIRPLLNDVIILEARPSAG